MISPSTHASQPVFTVVISEKGGAERRVIFDRAEITVGRVQGNDLTLPKGNVSKRHARLLFRDGRFIVTDMNSTNGTYVNRRRISQATIVREGDRIYVGDFVLRIELQEGTSEGVRAAEASSSGPTPTQHVPSSSGQVEEVLSAQPVESDPGIVLPKVPGPPRVPATTTPVRADSISDDSQVSAPMRLPQEPSRPNIDSRQLASTQDSPGVGVDSIHRSAVAAICRRVEEMVDANALDHVDDAVAARVERLIDEQSRALRGAGEIAADVSLDRLTGDTRAELLGLGPIGTLLEDPEVTSVTASRFDRVIATRAGRQVAVEPGFSSEASMRRIIARLCELAGTPLDPRETVVERRLPDGVRASAVFSPGGVLAGALLVLQKPRRVSVTLDDLVRSGTVSRAMATFLQYCVQARANILIVGPREAGAPALSSALAAAAADGPVVALEDVDSLVPPGPHVTRFAIDQSDDAGRLIHVASRMDGARLVVELATSDLVAGVLEVIGEGADGVVAVARAPGIRRAATRLTAEVVAGRGGTSAAAAREWIAGAFDVVVEISRLRDGRQRVLRVVELSGVDGDEIRTQDIFTFNVERTAAGGAIEGTFTASGAVPRVVEEMNARGVPVETSLFTRPPSR